MVPEIEFEEASCTVEPESLLYVFSDGVYEITDGKGDVWGLEALIKTLAQQTHPDPETTTSQVDRILHHVRQTNQSGHGFDDDLSLLEVRFC
jgi:sigma-B regulation protein RsbU (phosphoserine phosphatase)